MNYFKKLFIACLAVSMIFVSACSTTSSTAGNGKKAAFPEEKLGWMLGSQAYTFRLFTFAQALDKIDSAGLRHVEAFPGQAIGAGSKEQLSHNLSAEGRAFVKQLLKDKNISIQAYGVIVPGSEEEWEKVFVFAKELGIKVLNTEPKVEHLDIISKLADQYDIKVAIHNHPDPSYYWNPDLVLKALEGRSKRLGATADVGHWMRSGLDPVESLKKLSGRIYHIHFKDLNEFNKKNAHDVHWGTGKLGLKNVIEELKRQKYKGMIAAEYEYNWENNMNDVKISAVNFRAAL
ncbi:sugar phosphate isomerase/epimerase family protein [Sphingobacterium sp. HJSM2_6]|uniref:sugar phosphate isomerase/epimerase family protein n=1 Tax=Sphingobacterium sp. HJSM2_6 TaxID=3366264 RepID=UPI003BDF301D